MTEQEIKKAIKGFAEGTLSAAEFQTIYATGKDLRQFCDKFVTPSMQRENFTNFNEYVQSKSWDTISDLYDIHHVFSFIAIKNGIITKETITNKYLKDMQELSDAIPEWVGEDAMNYIEKNIFVNAPKEMSKSQQFKWLKEQIKETFVCENGHPRWAQGGTWPMDKDGKPMVFRGQTKNGEEVTYTFVDKKSGKEEVVKELY